jgi:hypothetical protein
MRVRCGKGKVELRRGGAQNETPNVPKVLYRLQRTKRSYQMDERMDMATEETKEDHIPKRRVWAELGYTYTEYVWSWHDHVCGGDD